MSPPTKDSPDDLSKRYPADFTAWRDRPQVTLREAVLLSLSIDPETLTEAQELDALASVDAGVNPETVELEPPYYHAQHEEYTRRIKAIQDACRNDSLASERRASVETVRLAEFVRWAGERAWRLPPQLIDLADWPEQNRGGSDEAASGSSVFRDETQETRAVMRNTAIRELGERPNLANNMAELSRRVARRMKVQSPSTDLSESYIRNSLFYGKNPLISAEEWVQLKASARNNQRSQKRQKIK